MNVLDNLELTRHEVKTNENKVVEQSSLSSEKKMNERKAVERISKFSQKFGVKHFRLACHAAFPSFLTPDLLYQIWLNFVPEAPWTAVSDLLLSPLCNEVEYELFEMSNAVRELLLNELIQSEKEHTIKSLANFLEQYSKLNLNSFNPDKKSLSQVQRWTALAYTSPHNLVQELAQAISISVKSINLYEALRLTSLVSKFTNSLSDFPDLKLYADGVANWVNGNEKAIEQFEQLKKPDGRYTINDIHVSLPSIQTRKTTLFKVGKEITWEDLLKEANLPYKFENLPTLDLGTFNALIKEAQSASQTRPKRGWAIATFIDNLAQKTNDIRLQAMAAFYLAWAANEWVQPTRVAEAAARAQTVFEALHEPGWVAGCLWQKYALPWTHNNFAEATEQLTVALAGLQEAGMDAWVPHCQMSLAYAHLLRGEFELAQTLLQASRQTFTVRNDRFHLARNGLFEASLLRRQGHFDEVFARLQEALPIFQTLNATGELGKVNFHFGHYHVMRGEYFAAETHFRAAIEQFETSDLPLWTGQCLAALAEVHNNVGRPQESLENLIRAGTIYAQFEIVGLRADNLIEQARIYMLRGEYATSLDLLRRAEANYERIQVPYMSALAALYQGEACLQFARYQQALHHLERAYTRFHTLEEPGRQAESTFYLAQGWLAMGDWHKAQPLFETAIVRFRDMNQYAYLSQALNNLGDGLLTQGRIEEALLNFEEALTLARVHKMAFQALKAQQQIGVSLARLNRFEEAYAQFKQAIQLAKENDLIQMMLSCILALADAYWQNERFEDAKVTWEAALALQESAPEYSWKAHVGLGTMAVRMQMPQLAIKHYHAAVDLLRAIRQDIWQPHLAGLYAQNQVGAFMDQALIYASAHGTETDLLAFIEAGKAQSLIRQLGIPVIAQTASNLELNTLKKEISYLQNKLRIVSNEQPLTQRVRNQPFIRELREKMETYHFLQSQIERQKPLEEVVARGFSLTMFRKSLETHLGRNWIALDYYLTETHLIGVLLTPSQCQAWLTPISPSVRMALNILGRAQVQAEVMILDDYVNLSNFLFPADLSNLLQPDTYLFLSPHRQLNYIPWAILPLPGIETSRPLVTQCIPCRVPSLHVIELLYERDLPFPNEPGLAIAISTFNGRHADLPHTLEEIASLQTLWDSHQRSVEINTETTWGNMQHIAQIVPLRTRSFLHLATHAFYDTLTGRTTGFALADQDIWIDQFINLAPLPPLITISTDYGLQSRTYEGEEFFGLSSTCLVGGTNHVIGSIEPVLDSTSPQLMLAFYRFYQMGKSAAHSLALAQRELWEKGLPGWEGFMCFGLP